MTMMRRSYLAIGISVVLALVAVYASDMWLEVVLAGCAFLALWSLREPAVGLLGALPLVQIIHPTPSSPGENELAFAVVLASGAFSSLWHSRNMAMAVLWRWRWVVLGMLGLLILNASTAYVHGVSRADWLRGLAPFVFILYFFPAYLELARDNKFLNDWILTLSATAALFALNVVSTFIGQKLWRPNFYIQSDGSWIQIDPNSLAENTEQVYEFMLRVTQVLQQSTDLFVPLGSVLGAWLVLSGRRRNEMLGGTALIIASAAAMTLTYTRSMLMSAIMLVGLLTLWGVFKGKWYRSIYILLIGGSTVFATIIVVGLQDIYLNRAFELQQAVSGLAQWSHSDTSIKAIKDVNVTSRLEEYAIAWHKFLASPVLGQGVGVKHAMSFQQGNGNVLHVSVGYIHNWILYFLMVGGVLGFVAYATILTGPVLIAWRAKLIGDRLRLLLSAVVLLMSVYALFFAVFRLIPFNLVLGGIWGVVLYKCIPLSAKTRGE